MTNNKSLYGTKITDHRWIAYDIPGNIGWINAITAGWISVGNIWMFGGLPATMKLAKKEEK